MIGQKVLINFKSSSCNSNYRFILMQLVQFAIIPLVTANSQGLVWQTLYII